MKTMAVICEYNPFHNGHAYQISQHRTMYGVDCVIAVMSGNFVQRGAPGICDKWTRAKMALAGGCDLVLELPTVFATQSAERFAWGAVQLIKRLGTVDYLSFGSECGDINLLSRAARVLIEPDFQKLVAAELKKGISYPAARHLVLCEKLGTDYDEILSEPNNLLAIEYLKNILSAESTITPITLKRTIGHHDATAENMFCSASHLRKLIENGEDISSFMPYESLRVFNEVVSSGKAPAKTDVLNYLVTYLLRTQSPETLRKLPDMSEGLENRFINAAKSANTASDIAEAVKTKRYTRTRIDRTLIHLLLGITKENVNCAPGYFRVLGANSIGTDFLRSLKENPYPVINKTANAEFICSKDKEMFDIDCRATDIYAMLYPDSTHSCAGLDLTHGPVIL